MWDGKKLGIPMNQAGQPVKQALGDRWLGSHERQAANMPVFSEILAQDPYFSLKSVEGSSQVHVKLRISRLSQLITNPDLIKEYRNPGRATAAAPGSAQNQAAAPVRLSDEGLPIRPGQPVCQHYVKHGWCLFKQDCWYSHPPDKAGKKKPCEYCFDASFVCILFAFGMVFSFVGLLRLQQCDAAAVGPQAHGD